MLRISCCFWKNPVFQNPLLLHCYSFCGLENAPKYSASNCRNLFSRISHFGEGRDDVQLSINGLLREERSITFVQSLRTVIRVSKHMYNALIKANTRVGGDSGWILDRMSTDNTEVDEETQKKLSSTVMVTKAD